VRAELEAAVGRVLTNPGALALLRADFDGFSSAYELDRDERERLGAMRDELATLHRSFTMKRRRALRSSFPYSDALLGDRIDVVLGRYIDHFPPCDDISHDLDRFGDFLVDVLESWREPRLTVDVARAEDLRGRASRAIISGERIGAPEEPGSEIEPSPSAVLALRDGVFLGRFEHDMRNLGMLATSALDELPMVPSFHVVFRRRGSDNAQIWRLGPATFRLLRALDGSTPRGEIEARYDAGDARLAPLIAEGAVEILRRR